MSGWCVGQHTEGDEPPRKYQILDGQEQNNTISRDDPVAWALTAESGVHRNSETISEMNDIIQDSTSFRTTGYVDHGHIFYPDRHGMRAVKTNTPQVVVDYLNNRTEYPVILKEETGFCFHSRETHGEIRAKDVTYAKS